MGLNCCWCCWEGRISFDTRYNEKEHRWKNFSGASKPKNGRMKARADDAMRQIRYVCFGTSANTWIRDSCCWCDKVTASERAISRWVRSSSRDITALPVDSWSSVYFARDTRDACLMPRYIPNILFSIRRWMFFWPSYKTWALKWFRCGSNSWHSTRRGATGRAWSLKLDTVE